MSSTRKAFTKALQALVTSWSKPGPMADFFNDTIVWPEGDQRRDDLVLTFDGAGYDCLSCQNDYHIESYREALTTLCAKHGWMWEDRDTWAISFCAD